jgi:hypothetical protein
MEEAISSLKVSNHVLLDMVSYAKRIFINTAVKISKLAFRIAV